MKFYKDDIIILFFQEFYLDFLDLQFKKIVKIFPFKMENEHDLYLTKDMSVFSVPLLY